jgi:Abortive infection alpha
MASPDREREPSSAIPGMARLAARAWWNTTRWTVGTSLRATQRIAEVALRPASAGELIGDVRHSVQEAARELVGLDAAEQLPSSNGQPTLQQRGQQLLYLSRDVNYEEHAHPAYERLLDSLAPDEARILRMLLLTGPQPAVDVRTGGPLGLLNSRLIAPGMSMIGPRAGLKYVERVPSYLTNLNRLGLIWFSRETLRDPERYQVLEAQPEVLDAIHSVRAAKVVRRSIQLTPFGEGFCRASLLTEPERHKHLPEHASPARPRAPQPPALSED